VWMSGVICVLSSGFGCRIIVVTLF